MVSMLGSNRGISPLMATVLLIVFSVALGAVVMSWGESYIEEKAEFVSGAQETVGGCDLAQLSVIEVGGTPQVCYRNGAIDVWLDNGPAIDVHNIHARIVGAQAVSSLDNLLEAPLMRSSAVKVTLTSGRIGKLRQVKLTPKVMVGNTPAFCSQQALVIEKIPACE